MSNIIENRNNYQTEQIRLTESAENMSPVKFKINKNPSQAKLKIQNMRKSMRSIETSDREPAEQMKSSELYGTNQGI